MTMSLADRFWVKVDRRGPDDCWPWTAALSSGGYGAINVDGRAVGAHVVALELTHESPIPDGQHVDHVCHNRDATCPGGRTCLHRRCCNPAHLEAVTPAENKLRSPLLGRGIALAQQSIRDRTHCPHGHAYDEENTGRTKAGHRYCLTCNRERAAANYQKRSAA